MPVGICNGSSSQPCFNMILWNSLIYETFTLDETLIISNHVLNFNIMMNRFLSDKLHTGQTAAEL